MVTPNTPIRMKFDMRVLCICLMLTMTSMSGCLEDEPVVEIPIEEPTLPEGTFVTGGNGTAIDVEPLAMDFVFSDVGEEGAECRLG